MVVVRLLVKLLVTVDAIADAKVIAKVIAKVDVIAAVLLAVRLDVMEVVILHAKIWMDALHVTLVVMQNVKHLQWDVQHLYLQLQCGMANLREIVESVIVLFHALLMLVVALQTVIFVIPHMDARQDVEQAMNVQRMLRVLLHA